MDESRGWTVDGVEWTVFATLAEQNATPIIRATTVRVSRILGYGGRRNGRVRTRRVHPDVMRRMKEASGD